MKHEEKIAYMEISTRITGFGFDREPLDLLVSLYELVVEQKGEATTKDIVILKNQVKDREIERTVQETLKRLEEPKD